MAGQAEPFRVQTIQLDLPSLSGAFSHRLRAGGLPVSPERAAAFARALTLTRPVSRRRLYFTARSVFLTDPSHLKAFDAVFGSVFASLPDSPRPDEPPEQPVERSAPTEPDHRSPSEQSGAPPHGEQRAPLTDAGDGEDDSSRERQLPVPLAPSDEEVLREKRFDALSAHELAQLSALMARLKLAAPRRQTRRAEQDRHGERIDLRRTLRASMRTNGDPINLRRRRRRVLPRRIVLLCDISGSMEPYARAYLQFLTCATGGARGSEAFVFATRLTRVTRALASRNPERAIQNAASTAPDWSSGTRIGDALKTFNDRHGRRGIARGAVIVILSDGWERGDPSLVAREMERLARLAHRIVWVNPRAAAAGFAPRAAGMAAALPHCDALLSGHTLQALEHVVEAIGGEQLEQPARAPDPEEPEPWASATPAPGSSVAMPSGYGPSRGRTTPGWST